MADRDRITTREVLDQIAQKGEFKPEWLEAPAKTRVAQIVKRLVKQGVVKPFDRAQGASQLDLTSKGQRKLITNTIKSLKLEPGEWDGMWRLVAFDIPEKHKVAREALRDLLKQLRFVKFQESLWLSPWDARDPIDFARNFYQIKPYVLYLETDEIENELRWRVRFKL